MKDISKNFITRTVSSNKIILNPVKVLNIETEYRFRRKNLFINYYIDKNQDRAKEIDECLKKNIKNPLIDKIIIVTEENVTDELLNNLNKKIKIIQVNSRPTYVDFFNYANEISSYGDIAIVANSDIYFDETLKYLDIVNFKNKKGGC